MYKPSKRVLMILLALAIAGFAAGVWVLLHPASVFVQPWRAKHQSTVSKEVLIGPYPVEEDFIALKARGVTTIISLLEPNVPYEKVLLGQERKRAERYGMKVLNFPMGSILGQKFGDSYATNSEAAAKAALGADGIAYIHCYLGVHRAKNVQKLLAQHASTRTYAGTNHTTDADLAVEKRAMEAFAKRDFAGSLGILDAITRKTPRVMRLEAWNLYKLRRMPEARAAFNRTLAELPGDIDAITGLGLTELADGRLDAAETAFQQVLSRNPDEVSAVDGLAHVRYRQGRREQALALFERALALDPDNAETRMMVERLRSQDTSTGNKASTAAPVTH